MNLREHFKVTQNGRMEYCTLFYDIQHDYVSLAQEQFYKPQTFYKGRALKWSFCLNGNCPLWQPQCNYMYNDFVICDITCRLCSHWSMF